MNKKIICAILMGVALIGLSGCKKSESENQNPVGYQLNMPSDNEEVAIIKTTKGEFKMRFFDSEAPKAVENFKSLAKKGYYNGVIFHRVIKDFMAQTGDPTGTGTGGESTWGKDFEDEFSDKLFNITGAVAMANRGPNTNGSQFFINYQDPEKFSGWEQYEQAYKIYKKSPRSFGNNLSGIIDMSKVNEETKKLYTEHGGNPHLDGYCNMGHRGHTVFAQVFDGLDVIKDISLSETDQNDKPTQKIKIEEISFENYSTN